MIASVLQHPVLALRNLLPSLLTLLAALLACVPLRMPFDFAVVPDFALMAVFYWTLYRPDLLPVVTIFVIGLLQDLLLGGIVGVTPIMLICCHAVLLNQRRIFLGKPFALSWWGFAVVALAAEAFQWTVHGMVVARIPDILPSLVQAVATVLLFPLVVWLLVFVHRHLVPRVDDKFLSGRAV